MSADDLNPFDNVLEKTLHNASLNLKSDNQVISEVMLRERLRRILGKEKTGLDALHIDLIRILTGPDMAEYTLRLLKARNPELF